MGTWNWLDGILGVLVVLSVVTATLKGFVRELIALAATLVGLVVAALGYRWAAGFYEDLARSHEIALGAGFLTLFFLTLLAGVAVSAIARRWIKAAGLEWFDRFLGGIFGLIRGVVVGCILLLVLVAYEIKPEAVRRSVLAPYVVVGARALALVMPGDLKNQFGSGFEKFRLALAGAGKKATKN